MTTPADFDSGYAERQPVIVLLDTSASMAQPSHRPRIDDLNQAIADWPATVRSTPGLRDRVEACLITFDSRVRVFDPQDGSFHERGTVDGAQLFTQLATLRPPVLRADGYSAMLQAIRLALELARRRRRELRERGRAVLRPMIWLLTDGAPTDEAGTALTATELAGDADELRRAEQAGDCSFTVIGVQGADQQLLKVLAPNGTHMLEGLDFGQILNVLSRSAVAPGADVNQQISEIAKMQADFEAMLADGR